MHTPAPRSGAKFFLRADSDPPFKRTFHGKRDAFKRGGQHAKINIKNTYKYDQMSTSKKVLFCEIMLDFHRHFGFVCLRRWKILLLFILLFYY